MGLECDCALWYRGVKVNNGGCAVLFLLWGGRVDGISVYVLWHRRCR